MATQKLSFFSDHYLVKNMCMDISEKVYSSFSSFRSSQSHKTELLCCFNVISDTLLCFYTIIQEKTQSLNYYATLKWYLTDLWLSIPSLKNRCNHRTDYSATLMWSLIHICVSIPSFTNSNNHKTNTLL